MFYSISLHSDQRPEQSIASARAQVMVYDDANKKWMPSGSSHGLSKVHIYHHFVNGTFRVVGRKLGDHEVRFAKKNNNCESYKNMRKSVSDGALKVNLYQSSFFYISSVSGLDVFVVKLEGCFLSTCSLRTGESGLHCAQIMCQPLSDTGSMCAVQY